MKIKNLLSITLALSMFVFFIAGCSKTSNTNNSSSSTPSANTDTKSVIGVFQDTKNNSKYEFNADGSGLITDLSSSELTYDDDGDSTETYPIYFAKNNTNFFIVETAPAYKVICYTYTYDGSTLKLESPEFSTSLTRINNTTTSQKQTDFKLISGNFKDSSNDTIYKFTNEGSGSIVPKDSKTEQSIIFAQNGTKLFIYNPSSKSCICYTYTYENSKLTLKDDQNNNNVDLVNVITLLSIS